MAFVRLQPQRQWPERPRPRIASPIAEFAWQGVGIALAVATLAFGLSGGASVAVTISLAVFALAATVAGRALRRDYPHARLGLCNSITLIRLGLAASLVGPMLAGAGPSWAIFAVAATALAMDGFDGFLARRQGYVSEFGARFDMEVDSILALVLALGAALAGPAGAAAILLGLPRYLFGAAARAMPWMAGPLPERFSRKIVCVIQLGVLIALQSPALPALAALALAGLAAGVLIWSFALDVRWLWQRRR